MQDIFRKEQYSIRSILDNTGVSDEIGLTKTTSYHGNLEVLDSREFENNLLIYILTGMSTETSHYQPLLKEIDTIVFLINSDLEHYEVEND